MADRAPSALIRERVEAAAEIALDEVVDAIAADSMPLTPLDTGELRGSQTVETVEDTPTRKTKRLSWRTPYAAVQHENLEYEHPEPGTQAKYAEVPFKRHAPGLGEHVARRVREALHG